MEAFLNWGSLLSEDPSLYQVDIKLARTIPSSQVYTNSKDCWETLKPPELPGKDTPTWWAAWRLWVCASIPPWWGQLLLMHLPLSHFCSCKSPFTHTPVSNPNISLGYQLDLILVHCLFPSTVRRSLLEPHGDWDSKLLPKKLVKGGPEDITEQLVKQGTVSGQKHNSWSRNTLKGIVIL